MERELYVELYVEDKCLEVLSMSKKINEIMKTGL